MKLLHRGQSGVAVDNLDKLLPELHPCLHKSPEKGAIMSFSSLTPVLPDGVASAIV